eukprot:GDKI01036864.1.p1 GENE.GDKI01036864.1~~GDKI01036864.1.p1  ORF type:complete len:241 (+),score=47.64 GDKI01036864.1:71-724(+)
MTQKTPPPEQGDQVALQEEVLRLKAELEATKQKNGELEKQLQSAKAPARSEYVDLSTASASLHHFPMDHPVGQAMHLMIKEYPPVFSELMSRVEANQTEIENTIEEETRDIALPVIDEAMRVREVEEPMQLGDEGLLEASIREVKRWSETLPEQLKSKVMDEETADKLTTLCDFFASRPVGKEAPLLVSLLADVIAPAVDTAATQDASVLEAPRAAA